MNLKVNGEEVKTEESMTISDLLKLKEVSSPDLVTVEVNGDIIQRLEFDKVKLKENDKVEFLFLMAGGA